MELSSEENFTDIYNRLVEVNDKMHEANDPNAIGFTQCLYLMQRALKNLVGINHHIENTNLKNTLYWSKLRIDDFKNGETQTYQRNKQLLIENVKLRCELNRYKQSIQAQAHTNGNFFKKVEIDWAGEQIVFWINTGPETFKEHFAKATEYCMSKKKSKARLSNVKCWYLEYYRALGFECLARY